MDDVVELNEAIYRLEKENDQMRSLLDWRDHTMMAVEKDEFFRLRHIEAAARDAYNWWRSIDEGSEPPVPELSILGDALSPEPQVLSAEDAEGERRGFESREGGTRNIAPPASAHRGVKSCPLGICDGSGFVLLGDGDEDNCAHVDDRPEGDWTPASIEAYLWHYDTAHRFGDIACPWCSESRKKGPASE